LCRTKGILCIMSKKGTGTCQACGAQKKKCLKTFEAVRKLKKSASMAGESSCETSKSLQGREQVDTLHASTSAMRKLTVLDVVEIGPSQRTTQVRKRAPSVERGASHWTVAVQRRGSRNAHLYVCHPMLKAH